MGIKFIDVHAAFNATGYDATNEEPELFRRLLRGVHPKRVLSIASGGEIPLTVLLPRTREELIAVDHSYKSVAYTAAKALALEKHGVALKDKMTGPDSATDWWTLLEKLKPELPEPLGLHLHRAYSNDVRREWNMVPRRTLAAAFANLEKLTLLHGDLRDAKDRGPFDLIYLSNAHEHQSRDKKNLPVDSALEMLKPGGLILVTSQYGSDRLKDKITLVKRIRGYRTSWDHCLFRNVKPEVKAEAEGAAA